MVQFEKRENTIVYAKSDLDRPFVTHNAELARHYLFHSSLELNETAYLLGYEDAHSFFRAFHVWEGSPPGEWRARDATTD